MNNKRTILVIDDHDCIRLLLGSILSKNYEVVTKKDGLEAMAWLSSGNIPDLILLDLVMPSLDGFDFLKNLRTSGFFSQIPVLVLSGNNNETDMKRCYNLGINDFFQKPFNPVQLREKITYVFKQHGQPVKETIQPTIGSFFGLATG